VKALHRGIAVDDDVVLEALREHSGYLHQIACCTRLHFDAIVERTFEEIARFQRSQNMLRFAYSVKTNPDATLVMQAQRSGLLAEVISPAEVAHAIACGFEAERLVYNGPYPAQYSSVSPGHVFADSLESYVGAASVFAGSLVGVRLRPEGIPSHFGLPRNRLSAAATAIRASGRERFGVAFHVRPQDYGGRSFVEIVEDVLAMARDLEKAAGVPLTVFDVGGGKRPAEFDEAIAAGEFEWLQQRVARALPQVTTLIAEPGQALATSCEGVAARVLEVRYAGGAVAEIVLDAGFADVPQIATYPHRFFLIDGDRVSRIPAGDARIIGRTCLEYDILAKDLALDDCRVGDIVAIADCGAYDASMSFEFARG